MELTNPPIQSPQISPAVNFSHLGIIVATIILLLGATWMEKPELFSLKKIQAEVADADAPHYVAYVVPPEDQPKPEVLGASTNEGPQIIGDDGQVHPVDAGQVLGASTQGVVLSLDDIKVSAVPDSSVAAQQYFTQAKNIENGSIGDTAFGAALNSGDQNQINQQAQKLISVRDELQKLAVPEGLVKLQKLKIVQYNSSIALLQNFTQDNQNPDLVNNNFQQFLKSQQDLDTENIAVAQKYGAQDPDSILYLNSDGTPAASQETIDNFGSSAIPQSTPPNPDDSLNVNAAQ